MFPLTTLYRYFDKNGSLLYVGISDSISKRAHQHQKNSQWHMHAVSATLEHFREREDALAAESKAIVEEAPLYNIAGSNQYENDPEEHWLALIDGQFNDPIHRDVLEYIVDGIEFAKIEDLSSDFIKYLFVVCISDMYQDKIPCIACRSIATSKVFEEAAITIWELKGEN